MIYRTMLLTFLGLLAGNSLYCQENVLDSKTKLKQRKTQYVLGFGFTNCVMFPEKVQDKSGPIEIVPYPKWGFELTFKFGLIFYKIIGLDIETVVGALSTGARTRVTGTLQPNPSLPPDFGNNYFGSTSGAATIPYGGLNIVVHAQTKITEHADLSPRLGIKMFLPWDGSVAMGSGEVYNGSGPMPPSLTYELNDIQKYRWVPDLQMGLNFLIHPKRPQHKLVIGCYVNLGFVDRCGGYYFFSNLGPGNDSNGRIAYTSSYVGINLGYDFTLTKRTKEKMKREREKIQFQFSM